MKKVCLLSLLTALSILFSACKSTEEPVKKEEPKKNYIGWVDASVKDVTASKGMVQLTVKPNIGTYNISILNQKDKYIPVLSTVEEFTSTSLYLKTSKKTFKLLADNSIKTGVSKTANGLCVTYAVVNVADVKVNLDIIKSSEKNDFDIVKTTVTIENKGQRKETFALKQVLDTVLGETGAYHFYTYEDSPVKNEIMYRNPKNEKWFMSKNNAAALQLFFNGADTTEPEIVALANYSTLVKNGWEPDMLSFRTFDTVLSYNNSAVGVIWPSVKLLPKEKASVVYYMAVASDGDAPNGAAYVYGNAAEPVVEEKTPVVQPVEVSVVEEKKPLPPVEHEVYSPKEIPNMEFNVNTISKEQYSPEYIQKLLDRIAVLERNSSSVNREELLRLNAELDAILSSLRQ